MASAWIFDVTEATFDRDVIERSRTVPVLVDFWAAWCSPCRMLAPVLEKVISDLGGQVLLAKADTEANPGLSYRFGIQGIPAMKLFRDGRAVGELVGFRPEVDIRAFLGTAMPTEADGAVDDAEALLGSGDASGAAATFERALGLDPRHARALLGLAKLRAASGRFDEAEALYQRVANGGPEEAEADRGLARLRLHRQAAELFTAEEARARFEATPGDPENALAHGLHLAASGALHEAMEVLLQAVASSRTRERARASLTAVFTLAGTDTDEVRDARSRLARLLF